MKRIQYLALAVALALVGAMGLVYAASLTVSVVTPATPAPTISTNNILGVMLDGAPGFATGSVKSDGSGKTDIYFYPESADMFGRPVTLGELKNLSYYTKNVSAHAVDPRDWYIVIYTKPYSGDVSSATWYGDRIGAEPYFADAISDSSGTWVQWSLDAEENVLRWFESTLGYFGSYTDPTWASFVASPALSGASRGSQEILAISIQTGSGWANGFEGQLDGLRVELLDGSTASKNFEPFMQPPDRDSCKKNGWVSLFRADGSAFLNQGDCVSYVNTSR